MTPEKSKNMSNKAGFSKTPNIGKGKDRQVSNMTGVKYQMDMPRGSGAAVYSAEHQIESNFSQRASKIAYKSASQGHLRP